MAPGQLAQAGLRGRRCPDHVTPPRGPAPKRTEGGRGLLEGPRPALASTPLVEVGLELTRFSCALGVCSGAAAPLPPVRARGMAGPRLLPPGLLVLLLLPLVLPVLPLPPGNGELGERPGGRCPLVPRARPSLSLAGALVRPARGVPWLWGAGALSPLGPPASPHAPVPRSRAVPLPPGRVPVRARRPLLPSGLALRRPPGLRGRRGRVGLRDRDHGGAESRRPRSDPAEELGGAARRQSRYGVRAGAASQTEAFVPRHLWLIRSSCGHRGSL